MQQAGVIFIVTLSLLAATVLAVPSFTTSLGQVTGIPCTTGTGTGYQYLGIPFGKAPVGALRFTAPQAYGAFPGSAWAATAYGNSCIQPDGNGGVTGAEDCLFLNIYVPTGTTPSSSLPVEFFIYGGAFYEGTSSDPQFAGCPTVQTNDVILVTINYRLGPLGFLATPDLVADAAAAGVSVGNYGLLDQRLALQWVQDHIASFGGDKTRVMLFGESAGSLSVFWHLVLPNSNGLFSRAICESGSVDYGFPLSYANEQGLLLETAVNCTYAQAIAAGYTSTTECLRAQDASSLVLALPLAGTIYFESGEHAAWGPVQDGVEIQNFALYNIANGIVNNVDALLIGTNALEGSALVIEEFPSGVVDSDFSAYLNVIFGNTYGPMVYSAYDPAQFSAYGSLAAFVAMSVLTSDYLFHCPAYLSLNNIFANSLGASTIGSLYSYSFDASPEIYLGSSVGCSSSLGAFHSAELGYVFQTGYAPCNFSAADTLLATAMSKAWANFAATGNPSPPGYSWAQWTPTSLATGIWTTNSIFTTTTVNLDLTCDFLESTGIYDGPAPNFGLNYAPISLSPQTPVIRDIVDKKSCFAYDNNVGTYFSGFSVTAADGYYCCYRRGIQDSLGTCSVATCTNPSKPLAGGFFVSSTNGPAVGETCYQQCYVASAESTSVFVPETLAGSVPYIATGAYFTGPKTAAGTVSAVKNAFLVDPTSGAYDTGYEITTVSGLPHTYACRSIGVYRSTTGCVTINPCTSVSTQVLTNYLYVPSANTCYYRCVDFV